jgi:hypothetical protein
MQRACQPTARASQPKPAASAAWWRYNRSMRQRAAALVGHCVDDSAGHHERKIHVHFFSLICTEFGILLEVKRFQLTTQTLPSVGIPEHGGSPILTFEGRPEGHGIAEGYREGIVGVSRDKNSPAPFPHCSGLGYGDGVVELAVHTHAVSGSDLHAEVKGGCHGSILLIFSIVGLGIEP